MVFLAHGLGGRSDLPVPLWLALYGAAMAVVISFVALAAFWSTPRFEGAARGRLLPARVRRVVEGAAARRGARALGLVAFAGTLAVAVWGADDPGANPAPTWLYVWFWVGLVPASLLLGPVWRAMNPLRSLATAVSRIALPGDRRTPRPYPGRLGYWPAVFSVFAFVWLELVFADAAQPSTVAAFLVAYATVHVAFGVWYGPGWFDRADGFEVYSTLLGHLAPVGRGDDGRLVVRAPFRGLASLPGRPGLTAIMGTLLGSTLFDGITRTRWWSDLADGTTGVLSAALGTAGLLAAIGAVLVTYGVAVSGAVKLGKYGRSHRLSPAELRRRFAHSVLPIAVGYTVAHYFSLFVFQGQAGYLLASDPLGLGWNLFGSAGKTIDYTVISIQAIATVQIAAIVAGHVAGVVAAHDRAVAVFDQNNAVRSQYSLLAMMVLYTLTGIALLAGAGS